MSPILSILLPENHNTTDRLQSVTRPMCHTNLQLLNLHADITQSCDTMDMGQCICILCLFTLHQHQFIVVHGRDNMVWQTCLVFSLSSRKSNVTLLRQQTTRMLYSSLEANSSTADSVHTLLCCLTQNKQTCR